MPRNSNVCGIYEIYNKFDRRAYVGQSMQVRTRLRQHLNALQNGSHDNHLLQADWNRLGIRGFQFRVIKECQIHQLDALEDRCMYEQNVYYNQQWSDGRRIVRGKNGRVPPPQTDLQDTQSDIFREFGAWTLFFLFLGLIMAN